MILEEEEREQHKLGRQIVREEHWLRYGVTARRKRNMRRLGELQSMRQRFRSHRGAEGLATMVASEAAESGKLVLEAKNISKSFGDLIVVKDFSTRIQRGDRIGLVGPNGAGKTTLLKMLTGELAPDGGSVRLGTNLEIATLDQKREALDPQETLAHYLTDGRGETVVVNGEERHVVSWMKDFLFKPEMARTPVRELSGGERARLILAARARAASQPSGARRTDQRPRHGDAGAAAGTRRGICRARLSWQPRPRFPRPHGDLDNRARRPRRADGRWIEYAGGYSDMLAQRKGAMEERKKVEKAAEKPKAQSAASVADASKGKGKLSYKQKFALETLPKEMAKAEAEIARREEKMADPDLFSKNTATFNRLAAEMEKLRDNLTKMEEEWLELEMLREELEG